jgi:glycosyltransferase involved in cell wall biosynthesis
MAYLTVAIPTMKRWFFLKDSLPTYLDRPEVGEVLICDETGEDVNAISKSSFRSHPKLRLVINDSILGIYQNKVKCMNLARYKWIALLDSDNYFMDDWFDRLNQVLNKDNPKQIYASASFITSNIETSVTASPAAEFTNTRISKANWNAILNQKAWNVLLNDGNWVVSKEASDVLSRYKHSLTLHAADAIYMLREFILSGYEIWYVPELNYIHTVHSGSSWLLTEKQSTRVLTTTSWYI